MLSCRYDDKTDLRVYALLLSDSQHLMLLVYRRGTGTSCSCVSTQVVIIHCINSGQQTFYFLFQCNAKTLLIQLHYLLTYLIQLSFFLYLAWLTYCQCGDDEVLVRWQTHVSYTDSLQQRLSSISWVASTRVKLTATQSFFILSN